MDSHQGDRLGNIVTVVHYNFIISAFYIGLLLLLISFLQNERHPIQTPPLVELHTVKKLNDTFHHFLCPLVNFQKAILVKNNRHKSIQS